MKLLKLGFILRVMKVGFVILFVGAAPRGFQSPVTPASAEELELPPDISDQGDIALPLPRYSQPRDHRPRRFRCWHNWASNRCEVLCYYGDSDVPPEDARAFICGKNVCELADRRPLTIWDLRNGFGGGCTEV